MAWLEQVGIFQAMPIEGGIRTYDLKAVVAVEIKFLVIDWYSQEAGQFEKWIDPDTWVWGRFFVVGKNGQPNEFACRSLKAAFDWDGRLESLHTMQAYRDRIVQITVEQEEFEGKVRYGVAFLNNIDRPAEGGAGNTGVEEVRSLDALHGSAFRALLGGADTPDDSDGRCSGYGSAPAAEPAVLGSVPDEGYDLDAPVAPAAGPAERMVAAFGRIGVSAEMVEVKVGKPLSAMVDEDFVELRRIYDAIQGGDDVVAYFHSAPAGDKIPF